MKTFNAVVFLYIVFFGVSNTVFAQQNTVGRLMDLEFKVSEKKLLDELEKNVANNSGGLNVPPIALVGAPKLVVPQVAEPTKPVITRKPPMTLSVFGVGNDLKADVVLNGTQYQAIKGAVIANHKVKEISSAGVLLETQVVTKKRGKKVVTPKSVFAPISST